ncbi:porin [Paraburkholderia sediminicola]
MKKTLTTLAIAVCFATPAAYAQSNVTLYGNLDGGVAFFNNVGGKHLYTTEDGNYIPDLFGLRGNEDLGGGLHAIFNLEAGYSLSSGALMVPNQLFSRTALVGLKSDTAGQLTLGHQPDFMFDILSPYSTGYLAGSFYSFHQGNFDELANTFEFNNSVKYVSPSFGGLSFGGQFGFGNAAGNFAAGRNYAFTVQYKSGALSVGAAYANENDRFLELANLVGLQSLLGTPLPASGIVANNVENWGVGGSYALGNWLLHALFTQSRISTATAHGNANTTDFGVNYTFSPSDTLGLGVSFENFDGGNWATLTLSNAYMLSKRTSLYQQLLFQKASGAAAVASLLGAGQSSTHSQVGVVIGIQHWF